MTIAEKFLNFLEKHGRKRVIMDRQSQSPYLNRYYLFLKDRKSFPFNAFLHQFMRSDPDPQHCHPFGYFTLILKGGYWEWVHTYDKEGHITGERRIWRGPGHFRFCKAESFHRIEIVEPGSCWTLFMPGPQIREWGFLTHKNWQKDSFKWVHFEDFLKERKDSRMN